MAKITFVCSFFKASRIQLFTCLMTKKVVKAVLVIICTKCVVLPTDTMRPKYIIMLVQVSKSQNYKNMKTKIRPIWAFSLINRSISCKKSCRQKGLEFGIDKFVLLRLKSLYLNSCTTSGEFFHKTLTKCWKTS